MSRYGVDDPVGIREHRVKEALDAIHNVFRNPPRDRSRLETARDRDDDILLQYERTLFAGLNGGALDTVADTNLLTAFDTHYEAPDSLFSPATLRLRRGFKVEARGVYTNTGASPTLDFLLTYNGVTMLTTGSISLTAAAADDAWHLEATILQSSDEGKIEAQGMVHLEGQTTIAATLIGMPNTTEATVTITDGGNLEVQVIWDVASVGNTITQRILVVTGLGSALTEVS